MARIISYVEKDCFIHRLSGLSKLIFFLVWTITSMLTYDTRVLAAMFVISIICFKLSKIYCKEIELNILDIVSDINIKNQIIENNQSINLDIWILED